MTKSNILCPGIKTIINDKTNEPIIHYLMIIDQNTGNLMCDQNGCKFCYKDKNGNDVWQTGFLPSTIETK